MVGQGDARELGHSPAAQRNAVVDEPRDPGQLAGLGQVQQVATVRPIPQDADHLGLRQGLTAQVCRQCAPVEPVAVGVPQVGIGDTSQ